MYYLRSQAATQAVQFTIEKQGSEEMQPVIPHTAVNETANSVEDITVEFTGAVCTMEEGCVTCSS
ncbi:MAG: hypothetical protein ABI415_07790 [Flavitalea sp.]